MVEQYEPVQTTTFSKSIKIKARLWRLVWLLFYRPTPWFLYRYRVWLLNLFGASVDSTAHPENSSFVEFPWNLKMGEKSSIGERSWIYCLDKISIGKNSCIGQGCKLITGSHNYRSNGFEMVTAPITIGDGCWLTSSVTVLMGIQVGNFSVVGVDSLISKSIPENVVAFGHPAIVKGKRFK